LTLDSKKSKNYFPTVFWTLTSPLLVDPAVVTSITTLEDFKKSDLLIGTYKQSKNTSQKANTNKCAVLKAN